MANDKSPVEHLLDLFVYVPLGLLWESRSIYPKLAEKGRAQLGNRVQAARLVGQFAVQRGQREASNAVSRLREPKPTVDGQHSSPTDVTPSGGRDVLIPVREDLEDAGGVIESDLAIPSYGSLAASQVVSRLDGLSVVELEAVRRYEVAHRGRKTVLGKVAHLQSPA